LPPTRSQVGESTELFLDLAQNASRQCAQGSDEPPIVDRATLVDHDLAILAIAGDSAGQWNSQQVFSREASRTGQDPGRGMPGLVEQVRLNDQDGPHLSWLRAQARAEVRKAESTSPNPHDSSRPSEASGSSSFISWLSDSRVARDARR